MRFTNNYTFNAKLFNSKNIKYKGLIECQITRLYKCLLVYHF